MGRGRQEWSWTVIAEEAEPKPVGAEVRHEGVCWGEQRSEGREMVGRKEQMQVLCSFLLDKDAHHEVNQHSLELTSHPGKRRTVAMRREVRGWIRCWRPALLPGKWESSMRLPCCCCSDMFSKMCNQKMC